jgi:16S rRNA (guanine527-N7)-methyltransferase
VSTDVARAALARLDVLLADAPKVATLLPHAWHAAAARYVALLLDANARVNLTRVVTPEAIARDHLLDALAALPVLDESGARRVIDLGSGGGVPAIPLALARPDLEWVLVDSVRKKGEALRAFVAALELRRVTVLSERLETLGRDPAHRERHDLATARACAPLPVLVELALPLVRASGALLAWKGPLGRGDAELRAGGVAGAMLGGGRPQVRPSGLAALGGRTLVTVAKLGPTPPRFPRRAGEPARRPLS